MFPLCADEGVGVIPWSPLARGLLTREWGTMTTRSATDNFGKTLYESGDEAIVDAVGQVAQARGLPRARIALAWVLRNPVVTAPIVGATKASHLDDAVAALDLVLTPEETQGLEALYTPHPIVGFA